MAGLWPLSLQQRIDLNGKPYVGARAFFYEADTTTPLIVYQNNDLSVPLPNPVTTDGFGMFPAVYLDEADEFYGVRVVTAGGVILFNLATLPIYGPATGGGGGGGGTPVDPDTTFKTGDIKDRYGSGIHPGWVRCNGRTIGDATSGATERANADTQALFEYLWNNFTDAFHPVTGGRGASASADFASHKTITLLDQQGRDRRGVDGMGTTATGRLTTATITTGLPTQVGSTGGTETVTLTEAQIPVHNHTGATGSNGAHTHDYQRMTGQGTFQSGSEAFGEPRYPTTNATTTSAGAHTHTIANAGGGTAHSNLPPSVLVTVYIKL